MDWVTSLRHPGLTPLVEGLTFLGSTTFFLALFPIGYWLVDRRIFAQSFVLVTVAALVNSMLKAIFQVPRPELEPLISADGWSFPSGHAMVAAVIWPTLALHLWQWIRQRDADLADPSPFAGTALEHAPIEMENVGESELPARPLLGLLLGLGTTLLVAGVALSRVYLGVHTLRDVTWGVAFGALLACLGWVFADAPPNPWRRLGADGQAALVALLVGLVLAFLPRNGDLTAATAGGGLVGFWVGATLDRLSPGSGRIRGLGASLAALAIGFAGIVALRYGLRAPLEWMPISAESAQAARYLSIGLFVAYLAPRLFQRLNLAD